MSCRLILSIAIVSQLLLTNIIIDVIEPSGSGPPFRRAAIPKGPPFWKLLFMVVAGNYSSWYCHNQTTDPNPNPNRIPNCKYTAGNGWKRPPPRMAAPPNGGPTPTTLPVFHNACVQITFNSFDVVLSCMFFFVTRSDEISSATHLIVYYYNPQNSPQNSYQTIYALWQWYKLSTGQWPS